MCEIGSSPRNNSLYAFINSVRHVACNLQDGLQLVLQLAHYMEVLHLDRQALVKINRVSWIEIVKELVKVLRPLRIMLTDEVVRVGNRSMLTSRLARWFIRY